MCFSLCEKCVIRVNTSTRQYINT